MTLGASGEALISEEEKAVSWTANGTGCCEFFSLVIWTALTLREVNIEKEPERHFTLFYSTVH
jgi:hypothetical protein